MAFRQGVAGDLVAARNLAAPKRKIPLFARLSGDCQVFGVYES
jgi:hypothetical protein